MSTGASAAARKRAAQKHARKRRRKAVVRHRRRRRKPVCRKPGKLVRVRVSKRSRRTKLVCRRPRRRRKPVQTPPKLQPRPAQPGNPLRYGGAFGPAQAARLLWRAGFGPRPGEAEYLASAGMDKAVAALTSPSGAAQLNGPGAQDDNGDPLAPADAYGHDHLYWMDRMVRSSQPLVERMALIWHDWFATSNAGVGQAQLMLDQTDTFRSKGLGSFYDLLVAVTADPAMLLWLNGNQNHVDDGNENYGRELQELFTLGADRGAYTEADVREMSRALTGFVNSWSDALGAYNFRFDPSEHDVDPKTIHGRTGNFSWRDACRLCVEHPMHPSFFVAKLWSYFIPTPPNAVTRQALEKLYVATGYQVRPIVETILKHPDLYQGAAMVKPPVVYAAGLLKALGRGIDSESWVWRCERAGQRLYYPPNVAGWDDARWLDTSTLCGRWDIVSEALEPTSVEVNQSYDLAETPDVALQRALEHLHNPPLTWETRATLLGFASSCLPNPIASYQRSPLRASRQNALRTLIATCPDAQTA